MNLTEFKKTMNLAIWMSRVLKLCTSLALIILVSFYVCSCTAPPVHLSDLAKTDIDMVVDLHIHQTESLMRELTQKLYRRNPIQLRRGGKKTLEQAMDILFNEKRDLSFPQLDGKLGTNAMLLALDEEYSGDRVFALMTGLLSMIRTSYGNKAEFFMLDELEPQALYNSARNIEILVWRLKTRVDDRGKPIVWTNNQPGEEQNLSYERLFGQLISLQDTMALIAGQKWNRSINFIVRTAASSVFLPVGL